MLPHRSGSVLQEPVLAAAPFNWSKLLAGRQPVPHFLSEFTARAATAATGSAPGMKQSITNSLANLSSQARKQKLLEEVSQAVAGLLGTGE